MNTPPGQDRVSVGAFARAGAARGVLFGVAWEAVVLELYAFQRPGVDTRAATGWFQGVLFCVFPVAPVTAVAGAVAGALVALAARTAGVRSALTGGAAGALLTMVWASSTLEERVPWPPGAPLRIVGHARTSLEALLFSAQHLVPLGAAAGAIVGAAIAATLAPRSRNSLDDRASTEGDPDPNAP